MEVAKNAYHMIGSKWSSNWIYITGPAKPSSHGSIMQIHFQYVAVRIGEEPKLLCDVDKIIVCL